jgi:HAD superfamily hydrolase (TIGR01509 family)
MNSVEHSLPRGVIFDMDGVLVDSEPLIYKAACMMYKELGLTVQPEDFVPFVGMGESRCLRGVAEKHSFPIDVESAKKQTYDIYLDIIKGNLKPLKGVFDFIEKCKAGHKKIALASSADIRKVKGNLNEIGLLLEEFDACITGEDVQHKKPNPEVFLLAADRLKLPPSDCLVVEDAVSGVTAAKMAGARCLALTTSFTQEQLDGADYYAEDLSNTADNILNW